MSEKGHESPESEIESARITLRNRWELASVLNFLNVFDAAIKSNLKISAKEVEMALIVPNKCLAQLHITLLKGIPPVSKNLKDPDAWVVALSKKLAMWWPWVAEGDFPLSAAKGKEMATYKELDPIIRLVILKALCEIRADQHDVVSYINDGVKNKNELSTFRKINIGEDGKGTSYWLDGNQTIGLRLYKEVNTYSKNGKLPTIRVHWETLATNLEEFQKVVDEYAPSKSKLEVAVSAAVETEAIPVLTKLYKKKQRELQKKKNEERVINNFCRSGITRSCRNRKAITYTFDEYDKAITEAIRETKRMKTRDEKRSEKKETVANKDSEQKDQPTDGESSESDSESSKLQTEDVSEESGEESDENDEDNEENTNHSSKDGKMKTRNKQRSEKKETKLEDSEGETTESDTESSEHETVYVSEDDVSDDCNEDESGEESDETDEDNKENTNHISKENGNFVDKIKNKKVTENGDRSIQQIRNFGTKKRLRQRPNRNTSIVPDSEDEVSSENSDYV